MEVSLGVRKGAWTEEEDKLLKECIEKYGEGRWHQVPFMAGLNRCRKSCRLRWLNYLKPNIKRGEFAADEVDLIVRMQKLLGNRWSLIAGRLPGRTANDVKNYWNTHLRKKKKASCSKEDAKAKTYQITKTNIIKPRPLTFSKNVYWFKGKYPLGQSHDVQLDYDDLFKPTSNTNMDNNNKNMWWESLLDIYKADVASAGSGSVGEPMITTLFAEEDIALSVESIALEEAQSCWGDLSFDVDLWNLFNSEQETRQHCEALP